MPLDEARTLVQNTNHSQYDYILSMMLEVKRDRNSTRRLFSHTWVAAAAATALCLRGTPAVAQAKPDVPPAVAPDAVEQTAPKDSSDERLQRIVIEASGQAVSRYVGASSNAAARLPADPMELPVAGTSVPRAVLDDQGILRPADAVRNVSGVTRSPAYLGLTDSYRIRGFAADVGLWNGFRRDFYYSFTDPVHIERIEVIKGAASVTYGDLEPGGVVNYVTKRPSKRPAQSVGLTVGAYGLVRPEFDVGFAAGTDGSVRLRLTGAHERAGSHRDFVENTHSTLGLTADWDVSANTTLEFSAYWLDSENTPDRGFFNSLGPLVLTLPPSRFLGEPDDRYLFTQTDASALLSHRLAPNVTLRAGVNIYRVEDLRDNIQLRDLLDDGRTLRRQYTYVPSRNQFTTLFSELRADVSTGPIQHTLVAGYERIDKEYFYDFRRDRSSDYAIDLFDPEYGLTTRVLAPSDRYDTESRSEGFYLQDLMALGEHWRLLAGLRHSRYQQSDVALDAGTDTRFEQTETTPRLGVLYRVSPEQSVFASYGRSFAPQVYNYSFLRPGEANRPERGDQFELGWKYTALDERVVAGITAFRIRKQNVATTDPLDPDLLVLTGEQTARGIEFDGAVRIGAGTSALFSYAWLDAFVSRDNSLPVGDTLVNSPRQQASVWLRHDLEAVRGMGVGVGVFAVGRREAELPNTWSIPGYARLDASVYWKPAGAAWDVALHVKNLLDKTYYDSQGNLLYPGAPLAGTVVARYRF
jgi:iron complex outermembrane recepter protein